MKIAIIGAGFAGLAAAYYLSENFQVTLFDLKGIGGGASGISSGLLHPYPGEKGRRSWHADEALLAARELLTVAQEHLGKPVAHYEGILKVGECLDPGEDVEPLSPGTFLIKSGITVFPELYLEGLWQACQKRGVELVLQKIESLQELADFDQVILAVGAGIRNFPECRHLKINFVKGQVLTCALEKPLERSISSKRYRAITPSANICHLGATYERDFTDESPNKETAIALLQPEMEVLDCRAGIRVTNPAHYFPILEQIDPKTWAITALGSRGLLYHAYLGKKISENFYFRPNCIKS
ncbi:MAG TPA: FAD-dependent oxidoreductase [Rhabdochlamydiaceae bacterium]|nr:FAD-dependent oxidoreductase [Rhabdochlamydiaceae bacterium]